ncbi:hypothetical protein TNCT_584111 [Trichonephila clavata]|uniref:Uncharacterized protein n=1 Tax=Trichonephila clavata TaxID=2740835 RepID=A0A8X6KY29_TRICU|nr:hypothetical protein TNCT_584111 [Trichonephila clavata]
MAKLLCAFVLAALVFQVSAWEWPPRWVPSLPNIGWLNPLNWFGRCNRCELQGTRVREKLQETLRCTNGLKQHVRISKEFLFIIYNMYKYFSEHNIQPLCNV